MNDDVPTLKTVVRAPKGTGQRFARILNSVLQDERLSFRARGVMAFVLSKPDHWRHSAKRLAAGSTEGVDAIQTALRELGAFGYLSKILERTESGTLRTALIFQEQPERENPVSAPEREKPSPGQPGPGQPRSYETTVERNDCRETTVEKPPLPPEGAGGQVLLSKDSLPAQQAGDDAPGFPHSLDTPEFRSAWADWLAYRRESRFKPWVPRTVQAQLETLASLGSAAAVAAIRRSIASGWRGIFPADSPGRAQRAQGVPFFK